MKKPSDYLKEKRAKAHDEMYNATLTRNGASEIAKFFISTVPWSRLVAAYEVMKERGVCK